MNVAFISLGCAKNLVNTEQMMALAAAAGHVVTGEPRGADVAVLNTCGFIDAAKSEAIDHILDLAQLKAEGQLGKLLVAGCLTQRYREELQAELPEVDGMLGTGSYSDIVTALEELAAGRAPALFGDIHHTVEDGARLVTTPSYTAYLKIAEGCDNRCSFCVIPSLRGRYRSRAYDSLLEEAGALAKAGVTELIVIAQDITRYGTDRYGRRRLGELLTDLCAMDFHWIRLHYLYPDQIDDSLIEVIAREPKIVKYIDLPLQHIDDSILKAMRRRSTGDEIRALLDKLRAAIPDLVLRTSLICGFPGEEEAQFEALCDFLRSYRLQRVGIFPFSPEEGTVAASLPGQIDPQVATHRAALLNQLQAEVMDQWNESLLGHTVEVLCEGFDQDAGCYAGRTWADSPEVDGRVLFTAAGKITPGTFVRVLLTGTDGGDLIGEQED